MNGFISAPPIVDTYLADGEMDITGLCIFRVFHFVESQRGKRVFGDSQWHRS